MFRYWVSTAAASIFRTCHTAVEWRVQRERTALPQSAGLTCCEGQLPNYCLALTHTCQSRAGAPRLESESFTATIRSESDRIMSAQRFHLGLSLAWTWPLLFESPHHMTCPSSSITSPRKTAIITFIRRTSRDYWLWLLPEYSLHDMQFSALFVLICGNLFKYSWRGCLMVLQLNF